MVRLAVIIKRRMWNIRGTAEGEGGGGEAHQKRGTLQTFCAAPPHRRSRQLAFRRGFFFPRLLLLLVACCLSHNASHLQVGAQIAFGLGLQATTVLETVETGSGINQLLMAGSVFCVCVCVRERGDIFLRALVFSQWQERKKVCVWGGGKRCQVHCEAKASPAVRIHGCPALKNTRAGSSAQANSGESKQDECRAHIHEKSQRDKG